MITRAVSAWSAEWEWDNDAHSEEDTDSSVGDPDDAERLDTPVHDDWWRGAAESEDEGDAPSLQATVAEAALLFALAAVLLFIGSLCTAGAVLAFVAAVTVSALIELPALPAPTHAS